MAFTSIVVGAEAATPGGRSPFFTELSRICAAGISAFVDYNVNTPVTSLSDAVAIMQVSKLLNAAIARPMTDCIFKYTGMKMRSVACPNVPNAFVPNASCVVTMENMPLMKVSDGRANANNLFELHDAVERGGVLTAPAYNTLVHEASRNIDLDRLCFDPDINKSFYWDLSISVGIFAKGRVIVDDKGLPDGAYTRAPLTADEIAAVVLDRLGIGFYTVAEAMMPIKRCAALAQIFQSQVRASLDPNGCMEDDDSKLPTASSAMDRMKHALGMFIKASTAIVGGAWMGVVKTLYERALTGEFPKPGSSRRIVQVVTGSVFFVFIVPKLVRWGLGGNDVRTSLASVSGCEVKRGEGMVVARQATRLGTEATSFASHFGATASLVGAITKLSSTISRDKNINGYLSGDSYEADTMSSCIVPVAAMAAYARMTSALVPLHFASGWLVMLDELHALLREQYGSFRELPDGPQKKALVKHMIETTVEVETMIAKAKADSKTAEAMRSAFWFGDQGTRGTVLGGLISGNTHHDYARLMASTEDLVNNPMYFLAEQVKKE